MMNMKLLESPDLYTVGWIAAMPIEHATATAMLDERHDKPCGFFQHQADSNSYTWGKIGEHHVVIDSLPGRLYGTTSASATASNLLASLPQIRESLLVETGGGIARPEQGHDIRLGDVVVSQPQGTAGGVIQYDLGKAISNQRWERKGFIGTSPPIFLHALANLQAEHELGESRVPEIVKAVSKLKRYRRDTTDLEVHYVIIASGKTLVKDAATRDKIVEDFGEGCICFEMEAAGLMNHFPCLVIRGKSLRSPQNKREYICLKLANTDENYRDYAIRVLQFLTYSERHSALARTKMSCEKTGPTDLQEFIINSSTPWNDML